MLQKSSPILRAAASPVYLEKGCVNVIELRIFKEQAGARWSRISEGVYAKVEALLKAKLGPNDMFVRLAETAYLVTMPTTEPDDVNAVCMRVAFDLHMSFLGQCGLEHIEVHIVSMGNDDTFVLQRLPAEKVASLADRAGIPVSLNQGGNNSGSAKAQSEQVIQTKADRTAEAARYPYSPAEPPPRALMIEFQFIPIWSVCSGAVTTYACEPKKILAGARREPILLAHVTPKERIQIDTSAFQDGIDQLARAPSNAKFLLAVPISFEVLGSPSGRMDFLSACRDLSRDFRNLLIFIILDVPPGVAQSRLANMVTMLRPFARNVSATIASTERVYASYQSIGLHSIGFDLREFSPKNPITQRDIEQLAQFARRTGLGTFLSDVRDKSVLKYAQDAHIGHLSGPAVAPAATEPQGMWRLSWAETLARPDMEIWG